MNRRRIEHRIGAFNISICISCFSVWKQQLEYRHPKRLCQALEIIQRDVSPTPFNMGDKRPVQIALECQLLLRPAAH